MHENFILSRLNRGAINLGSKLLLEVSGFSAHSVGFVVTTPGKTLIAFKLKQQSNQTKFREQILGARLFLMMTYF